MKSTPRSRKLTSVMLVTGLGILVSGCAHNSGFKTFSGPQGNGVGACSAFEAPQYQIKGQTSYDQKWADKTTEAGVAGCDWKRPAKRPASLNPKPVKADADPYACFGAERYKAMSEGRTCADDPKPATFKKRWYDRFLHHRPAK